MVEVKEMIDKALKDHEEKLIGQVEEGQGKIYTNLMAKFSEEMKVMQKVIQVEIRKDQEAEKENEAKEKEFESSNEDDDKDDEIKELRKELKQMKESKDKEQFEDKKGKSKQSMTDQRGFSSLPSYDGKHEEFDDWKFKMKTFLSKEVEFNELLLVLEDLTEVPSETKAKNIIQGINEKCEANDTRWMNHQLYQVLCLNLEGKALKMVKNLHKQIDINGVIGWCKLLQDCSSMTSQRMQGLASKVYSPKRIKNYADVNAAIEEWETNAELFSTFETHPISMITKIFAIRQIVPAELEADIIRSTSLDTYDKMRAYVCEQVAMRRDVKNASKGPVALDLNMAESMWSKMMGEKESENETDESNEYGNEECEKCEGGTMMEQLFSFVKGQKGGKGGKGGKGRFDGNCHHCGAYGHRIADCWKKNEEVKGKGKGKSNDPFAAFGGKGGYGKGFGGKGKGKDGGKGYGKYGKGVYGFENGSGYDTGYDETSGKAWTLSLVPSKLPKFPPGLSKTETTNVWKALESKDEEYEDKSQREQDLKSMESPDNLRKAIGNYSKRSVKAARFPPIKAQKMKTMSLNLFYKGETSTETKELYPVTSGKAGEWQFIKGVVDSGAAESVAHPSMCPQYPVLESPGSKAGQCYTSASSTEIPNLGEQTLPVVTVDGRSANVKYQSADVSRALNSVSEICDGGGPDGQLVLFSKYGGQILNLQTGCRTPFEREEGIYTLGMWVRPQSGEASGFPRPGR